LLLLTEVHSLPDCDNVQSIMLRYKTKTVSDPFETLILSAPLPLPRTANYNITSFYISRKLNWGN